MTPDLNLLEPITEKNVRELSPGEWIWDNSPIERREHCRSLNSNKIVEPRGFRQIHILDLYTPYGLQYSKIFMLSNIDGQRGGYTWEIFEYNRYYKFKKGEK